MSMVTGLLTCSIIHMFRIRLSRQITRFLRTSTFMRLMELRRVVMMAVIRIFDSKGVKTLVLSGNASEQSYDEVSEDVAEAQADNEE